MANIVTKTYDLNITPGGVRTLVNLSQYENGRQLVFRLVGDANISIPSGSTAVIEGTKPDGNVYSGTGTVDAAAGTVTFQEEVQMTAVAGEYMAKVKVLSGSQMVASGIITMLISMDPVSDGAVESDSDVQGLIAEARQVYEGIQNDLNSLDTEVDVLSARMDTFAQLPPGSTSDNAELVDIRVGADGTTYPTAGDAVRGQVTDIKTAIQYDLKYGDESVKSASDSYTGFYLEPDMLVHSIQNTFVLKKYPVTAGYKYHIYSDSFSTAMALPVVGYSESGTVSAGAAYDEVVLSATSVATAYSVEWTAPDNGYLLVSELTTTGTSLTIGVIPLVGYSKLIAGLKINKAENPVVSETGNILVIRDGLSTTKAILSTNNTTVYIKGKNLLPAPDKYVSPLPYTSNGITFTKNSDGSVTINGTATAAAYFILNNAIEQPLPNRVIKAGGSVVTGKPFLQVDVYRNGNYATSIASGQTFTGTATGVNSYKLARIAVPSGAVLNNEVFYPTLLIDEDDEEYETGKELKTVSISGETETTLNDGENIIWGLLTNIITINRVLTIPQYINRVVGHDTLKIQLFGDSITDDYWGDQRTWGTVLHTYLGKVNATVVNSAVGGSGLGHGYTNGGRYADKEYNYVYDLVTDGTLQTDSDVIVIAAGTNDWAASRPLGTFGDDTTETVYGCLKLITEYIAEHTNALLIWVTPPQRYPASDQPKPTNEYGEPLNGNSVSLRAYCDAWLFTSKFYGLPCVDLNGELGWNRMNVHTFTVDGLHPNDIGDMCISKLIANVIEEHCV